VLDGIGEKVVECLSEPEPIAMDDDLSRGPQDANLAASRRGCRTPSLGAVSDQGRKPNFLQSRGRLAAPGRGAEVLERQRSPLELELDGAQPPAAESPQPHTHPDPQPRRRDWTAQLMGRPRDALQPPGPPARAE
jgi:hypothetical protein